MIYTYDELATRCLDRLDNPACLPREANTDPGSPGATETCPRGGSRDLYELLRERATEDATLRDLWDHVNAVPDWVDWDQIERGQKVFYRYAGPCIVGLTFQSLLGGMGSARVVETLARTGGFCVRVARRRLLDTFQHVLQVTRSLTTIQPGGEGFASTIRVRLLHASVRRRILALAARDPAYYSIASHGVPINDLDSLATALAFSATLIWISLPRQGIHLRAGEAADYLAVWRYVGHLLGAPTTPYLATPALARATMESLILTELCPRLASRVLADNMLRALARQPPTYASVGFLRAQARWLNGPALADALGVPPPAAWYHTLLVAGQCLLFAVVCYARRSVRAWDEAGVERMRRVLWRFALGETGGRAARHEFKYVPRLGKGISGADVGAGAEDDVEAERDEEVMSGMGKGAEKRNLRTMLLASVVVGWVAWLGIRNILGRV
jgi:hypothetical protein